MARPGSAADPQSVLTATLATTVQGAQSGAAAAAGTVVTDTGQLPAGTYSLDFEVAVLGVQVAGVGLVVEHRNAANGATVSVLGGCPGGAAVEGHLEGIVLAANERIRVVVGAVALPASTTGIARLHAYRTT
jgi:hypothetical protein